jgi:hypothetical protein
MKINGSLAISRLNESEPYARLPSLAGRCDDASHSPAVSHRPGPGHDHILQYFRIVRVFPNADKPDRPLDVGVGGFTNGRLILHIDHQNFPQNSRAIPLQDMDFERTTWGEWKSAHPESEICTALPCEGRADVGPSQPYDNGRGAGRRGD